MKQNVTKIYLNYLNGNEKSKMTDYLSFLRSCDEESKTEFLKITSKLYSPERRIDMLWDNGRYPRQSSFRSEFSNKEFYTIIDFEKEYLTEQMLKEFGSTDSYDFRYYYAISVCEDDRKMYLASFQDKYCPNWNGEYNVCRTMELQLVDFPILKPDGRISRMDNALHSEINSIIMTSEPLFVKRDGFFSIVVKDQHGNYCKISGESTDEVFRNYADNYTGYRNFRRQMESEWEIVDDKIREEFVVWKNAATGLKSDVEKFYGNGVVD